MKLASHPYSPTHIKPRNGREFPYKQDGLASKPTPLAIQDQNSQHLNHGMIAFGLLLGVLVAGASDLIKHKLSSAAKLFQITK